MNDKEFKRKYRKKFSQNPEKFYPVETLKTMGYSRGKCKSCGKHFWSTDPEREVCGDSACIGGYSFINNSPASKELDYTEVWNKFSDLMEKRGYTPINRYPVAARWRDDIYLVEASIDDFIPYVISGEIKPPANPLVVPQTSLRFKDLDNIGFTGAHYSLFTMIGQHLFTKDEYLPGKYLEDLYKWFEKGVGLDKEDLVFHEDFWSGSGNFGPCVEFFSGGLEIANQVYMQYKRKNSGYEKLETKALDMGMGQERNAWFTKGKSNSYEAVFPKVSRFLRNKTGVKTDSSVIEKFLPYSTYLNLDEAESAEKAWRKVAKDSGVGVERLEKEVKPLAAIYSIGDHTRALLIALNDGVLPSNTGGGYNLRVLLRRSMDFMQKYGWDIDLMKAIEKHSKELEDQFPELNKNLDEISEIIKHEIEKYRKTRKKAKRTVSRLNKEEISQEKILELYDSKGISPKMLEKEGIKIPDDFYARVAERHSGKEEKEEEEIDFDTTGLSKTVELYRDEFLTDFKAKVLKYENGWLALDKTIFYPVSGGQLYDKGEIEGNKVKEVRKKEGVIIHKVEGSFEEEQEVEGEIDWDRREQLMQHHTTTHIINGAARELFGDHIWQAGAKKTMEKARLDITHYKNISQEEMKKIEDRANEIIKEDVPVEKKEVPRDEAEKKYGFRIYQGGAVPGEFLRIVKINDIDAEACGGTHCDYTGEVERIILTGSKKIQDGVVRLEFKSGNAAERFIKNREEIKEDLKDKIDVSEGLSKIAEIYSTEVEEVPKVIDRFINEWKDRKERIGELEDRLEEEGYLKEYDKRPRDPKDLFESWKKQEKTIKSLKKKIEEKETESLIEDEREVIIDTVGLEVGALIRVTRKVTKEKPEKAVVLKGKNAMVGSSGSQSDFNVKEEIEKYAEKVQGSENFAKGFRLKKDWND